MAAHTLVANVDKPIEVTGSLRALPCKITLNSGSIEDLVTGFSKVVSIQATTHDTGTALAQFSINYNKSAVAVPGTIAITGTQNNVFNALILGV